MKQRIRNWLLNGLMLGVALVIGFALTETAVRFLAPQPTGLSHQDRYGLVMHWPNITRHLPQFGHDVSFNADGMRDRQHQLEKPAGTYRVLVLGDSFMEALQVPFETSLPSLVERGLAERTGRPVEVINGATSGWGTDDQLRYYTEYAAKYKPDLILVAMTLHNDISDNLREDWHRMQDGALVVQAREPKSFWEYKKVQLKAFIATRFQTYTLWRKVRHRREMRDTGQQLNRHIVELFHEPPAEHIARGYDMTEQLLGKLQAVAGPETRLALLLLPLQVQLTDSAFADFVRRADVPPGSMPMDRPQRLLTESAGRLGIPVIDLLPGFRAWTAAGREALYIDWDGHWYPAGHQLAADVAVEGLLNAGVTP